jgi:MFS family permease
VTDVRLLEDAEATGHSDTAAFWRFWTASTVSSVGDAVTAVALPLVAVQVLEATSLQVSLITAAAYVAWAVIGLPAGAIVHRLPLRGTQVAMDLVRALALVSIPVAWALGDLALWQLVAVALIVSFAGVVFDVGNSTFLPSVVPKQQLAARNSLSAGSHAAVQVAGPSLGGVLVQVFGAVTSLLVDVVSYLSSAALLQALPRAAVKDDGAQRSTRQLISAGWTYVVRHPVIRACMIAATAVNFVCGGLLALTPVFLVHTLGAPAGLVGLLIAAEGAGSLLGAAITTRLSARWGSARVLIAASAFGAMLALAMPAAQRGLSLVLFALGNAGFAGGVVVLSILARTHRQRVTPPALLPQVMATVRFVSWGAVPVGSVAAGLIASASDPRTALWTMAGLAFVAPLTMVVCGLGARRDLD